MIRTLRALTLVILASTASAIDRVLGRLAESYYDSDGAAGEYAWLFGEPPRRDAERLREGLVGAGLAG